MRKILMGIVAGAVALFGLFGVQIHLVKDIQPLSIIGALLVLGVWFFTDFRNDWKNFQDGVKLANQWNDPAFWTAAITSVVLPILTAFNVTLSPDVISIAALALSVIVPILQKIFAPAVVPDPVALNFRAGLRKKGAMEGFPVAGWVVIGLAVVTCAIFLIAAA